MRAALVALALLAGVAAAALLALPVPVLALGDGTSEFLGRLDEGEQLRFSYRQSIYQVPVFEEFRREGDRIALKRVRSSDVRSIEYLRWPSEIRADPDGMWSSEAPPSDARELVIRIAPAGEQRFAAAGWACDLLSRFGEAVVGVRAEQRPVAQLVLANLFRP